MSLRPKTKLFQRIPLMLLMLFLLSLFNVSYSPLLLLNWLRLEICLLLMRLIFLLLKSPHHEICLLPMRLLRLSLKSLHHKGELCILALLIKQLLLVVKQLVLVVSTLILLKFKCTHNERVLLFSHSHPVGSCTARRRQLRRCMPGNNGAASGANGFHLIFLVLPLIFLTVQHICRLIFRPDKQKIVVARHDALQVCAAKVVLLHRAT